MPSCSRALRSRLLTLLFSVIALATGTTASAASALPTSDAAPLAPEFVRTLFPAQPSLAPGDSATRLPDGRWLILGGEGNGGEVTATARILAGDGAKTATSLAFGLHIARAGHTATVLPTGQVLILGGRGADGALVGEPELFNPTASAFTLLESFGLLKRSGHSATLLADGRLLIAGGVGAQGEALTDVELLDPVAGKIERYPAGLAVPRSGHRARLLPSADALIAGGVDAEHQPLTDAQVFAPEGDRFEPLDAAVAATIPDARAGPAVAGSLPPAGATDVAVDALLAVRFTHDLNPASLNTDTVVLVGPQGPVNASAVGAENGLLLFVLPELALLPASPYTLFVQGAVDAQNKALPFTAIGFTTRALSGTEGTGTRAPTLPAANAAAARAPVPVGRTASVKGNDDQGWLPGNANYRGHWRIDGTPPTLPAPLQANPGVTALFGVVLRLDNLPLANVTLQIGNRSATTDAKGRFLLTNVSPGPQRLSIDGSTVTQPGVQYGQYFARVELKPSQTTALPNVIWLTKLDPRGNATIASPTTQETVVTTPAIPGLELRLPAGTVIRDSKGQIVTQLNLTAIPVDRPPFPLPSFEVPVYFTIQPGGATIQVNGAQSGQGARLLYPNYTGEVPGAKQTFWNYDAIERGWFAYGLGTISPDGKQAIPDSGVAVYELTGAMINGPDTPPPPGPRPCQGGTCCSDPPPPGGDGGGGGWGQDSSGGGAGCDSGGDPVSLSTGEFIHTERDLALSDLMPVSLTRTYRSLDLNQRRFGVGFTDAYSTFLWSAQQYQEVDLVLPNGGRVHYVRTSAGTSYGDALFQSSLPGVYEASTIAWNGNGWNLTFRDGRVWRFGDNQPLQTLFDVNGNWTAIRRSSGGQSGNIVRIDSSSRRSISFSYDSSNRVTSATDSAGRTFTYSYDTSGRLSTVTDPLNGVRRYGWGTNNRLASITDPNGKVMVQNVYDSAGRVTKQTLADGSTFQYAYTLDANGKITQTDLTDRRGNVRRVKFNGQGLITESTFPLGKPEAQTTTFQYDAAGHRTSMTDALGRTTTYQYDAKGNRTQVTALAGTANAATTTLTYEPTNSRVTAVTDPLGRSVNYQYDAKGNLVSATDPLGNTTTYVPNAKGQVTQVTDPVGNVTTFQYDDADLVAVNDPLGRKSTFFADVAGRPVQATDPLGNPTRTDYDALNRTTKITDPLGRTIQFGFDANGNLTSHKDQNGNTTTYTYNSLSKLATRTDALGKIETTSYDVAGQVKQFTDRKGQVAGVTYDARNRTKTIGFGATRQKPTTYTSTITLSYDNADRVIQIVDSQAGTITRTYDAFNRLTSETTPQGSVSYSYDAVGRRTSMTVAGQAAVSYQYDNGDRLTRISQGSIQVAFTYDALGRNTRTTLPNGVSMNYQYDAASQLTKIEYRKADNALLGDLTYSYDKLGRRTQVGGSFARSSLPAPITGASYNANNQLTNWNGATFQYDLNGNLISDGSRSYQWDARNQLQGISGAATANFAYDPMGRRTSKTVNGSQTGYVYDGDNFVQELANSLVKSNLLSGPGLDEVYARTLTSGNATQSYLTDAQGSAIALTDGSGATTTTYSYEPYGQTTASGAQSDNAQQYTGRENDGTGLYYYRSRYYLPTCGRFISEDPIGWASGQTNNYAYVGGDPVSNTDPDGEFAIAGAVIGAGIDLGFQLLSSGGDFGCVNWGSVGVSAALGAVGGFVGGMKWGSEFSHWIPARSFMPRGPLPKWMDGPWNGSWTSNWRHYKHDPFRYSKTKGEWRDWGDKWNPAIQQADRVPDWMKGAGAGGALGTAIGESGGGGCQ